jgi:hypothetical protein
MFEEICLKFRAKYRVSTANPTSGRTCKDDPDGNSTLDGTMQEQWDCDSKMWTPCDDQLPHTLRAYMATFLSANPRRRFGLTRFDLQAFPAHIRDR